MYCVAAGFKPYRILKTHGFDATTRVVHFDYSPRVLEFRQRLIDDWDGVDYPAFLQKTFAAMPADTYFPALGRPGSRLRGGERPRPALECRTRSMGKPGVVSESLEPLPISAPRFILCDLMAHPEVLFEHIRAEANAVIWWSNAFFTIFSNWIFTIAQRRERYLDFINGLAAIAPAPFFTAPIT